VRRQSVHEPVEFGGDVADDFLPGGGGQMDEIALGVFLGIGSDAVGLRKFEPHMMFSRVELVDEFDADRVALLGRLALAPPVFGRRHLQIEHLELVLPHALQDVGDSAGAGLADDEHPRRISETGPFPAILNPYLVRKCGK
jgi:hypothetical protein